MPCAIAVPGLQHARDFAKVTLSLDGHGISSKVALDLAHRPIQHRAPLVDEHDAVTQRLHLVHLVGRHQDRFPRLSLILEHLLDQPRVHRVQAGEGLVHDDQVWIVQQSGDNLCLLLHAPAQLRHLFLAVFGQIEQLQPLAQPAAGHPLIHPLQRRQVDQRRFQFQVLVQPSILRHIADAALFLQIQRTTVNPDRACIRFIDIQHHADGRRLAGAIGTQQPKDLARRDGKTDVDHRLCLAKSLGQV